MHRPRLVFERSAPSSVRRRATRPLLEGLEERLLLYSTLGGQWTYGSRITYSFMPDGTSVGGTPSALFQTLNANDPTAAWEQEIKEAASIWENVTGINLALVSDGGEPVGCAGDQQDDPRFGDIRIGAIPLPSGILAETLLPPPINGGTDAGDILLNSTVNWQINSNYDLMTVVAHEFGHALGLGESSVSTAVMYGTYNGIKQALTSDDIGGIQSIYGVRPYDQFNSNGQRNNVYTSATNITSFIGANAQLAIGGLDNTTPSDVEWYVVTVPSSTTGTMTVTVQSSNLSSLSPKFLVYTSALGLVNEASAPCSLGATISTTTSVTAGQSYYIKVMAAGGPGPVGSYGLLINFGCQAQAPVPPPNTLVPSGPDQGGGTISNAWNTGPVLLTGGNDGGSQVSPGTGSPVIPGGEAGGNVAATPVGWAAIGNLTGWATAYTATPLLGPVVVPVTQPSIPVQAPVSQPGPVSAPPVSAPPSASLPIASPIVIVTNPDSGIDAGQAEPTASTKSSPGVDRAVHGARFQRSFHHKSRFAREHITPSKSSARPVRHLGAGELTGARNRLGSRLV